MPSFAGSADTAAPRFASGGGGGTFPKMPALVGALVMLKPLDIENVPGFEGQGMKDRLTADTTVLDGPERGEYPSMWWGQSGIVKKAAGLLRKNAQDPDLILGRLRRYPKKEFAKYWATPQALEAAIANGNTPVPNNAYFWVIEDGDTRADDIALATKVLAGEVRLDAPDEDDPFA